MKKVVLALAALGFGMGLGWVFLDILMGIVGGILVGYPTKSSEGDGDNQLADLHLWQVGSAARACIVSIVTHDPCPVDHYKKLLAGIPNIEHLTVKVNHCQRDSMIHNRTRSDEYHQPPAKTG